MIPNKFRNIIFHSATCGEINENFLKNTTALKIYETIDCGSLLNA